MPRQQSNTPRPRRSRARGRTRSRRARSRAPQGPRQQIVAAPRALVLNRNIQTRLDKVLHPKLSPAGLGFLKCAFAAPDFSVDPGKGIPDNYSGRTLAVKDCFTTALSFAPNTDTWIVMAPVPGYAYFTTSVPIGVTPTVFAGISFPSYTTNFGTAVGASNPPLMSNSNFTKFRYASMAVGLYPTSNMMQYAGAISIWKADMGLQTSIGQVLEPPVLLPVIQPGGTFTFLTGGESITPLAPRDNYTESFIKGAYTMSLDRTGAFEWTSFTPALQYIDYANDTGVVLQGSTVQPLQGFGNMETIVMKVTTPLGAVNAANLRLWNCIEMQINTNSNLYQFAGVSPPLDHLAMEAYGKLRNELPVAVPCAQNATFWARVLGILRGLSGIAALVPGPIGAIGGGISELLGS